MGKIPCTGKFPQRRIEPATLWTASPNHYQRAIPAPWFRTYLRTRSTLLSHVSVHNLFFVGDSSMNYRVRHHIDAVNYINVIASQTSFIFAESPTARNSSRLDLLFCALKI